MQHAGQWLAPVEALESALMKTDSEPKETLWCELRQFVLRLRSGYGRGRQSAEVVREIQALQTLEDSLQRMNPSPAELGPIVQQLVGYHLQARRERCRAAGKQRNT